MHSDRKNESRLPGLGRWFGLGAIIGLTVLLLAGGGRWLDVAAAEGAPPAGPEPAQAGELFGGPRIAVIADTSSGMSAQLAALSTVWDDTDIAHLSEALYSGYWVTDTVVQGPTTPDPAVMQSWLASLQAQDGGACPDAVLQALMATAQAAPGRPDGVSALLLTDSSPQGGRRAIARTLNRLVEQNVELHLLLSGWCDDPQGPPPSLARLLALMTGGNAFPVAVGDEISATAMALNLMAAQEDLLLAAGTVTPGEADDFSFPVAPGLDTLVLQVTEAGPDPEPWPPCLTCPLRLEPGVIWDPYTATFRLPGGTTIGPDDPGVRFFVGLDSVQMVVGSPDGPALPAGDWQLRIEGNLSYTLRLAAHAAIRMAYVGPHSVPAGRSFPVRVALELPPGAGIENDTVQSIIVPRSSVSVVAGPELYDDGLHGDGAAGDGIFGGKLTLPPGAYYLGIRGRLEGGGMVQRFEAA
ncbi:MAG: choice-of-anchor X domain-containing protein, partial [Candidatus Promineifilaceae bacterium]|nr:choice-of-anchor X domain-containing protein [Candidatus Promineifilaceae bacterium]